MNEQVFSQMQTDVNDLKIRMTVAENNIKDIKDDIRQIDSKMDKVVQKIDDNQKWMLRTMIGAIITVGAAVVAFLVQRGLH